VRRLVVGAGIVVALALLAPPSATADEVAPVRDSWRVGTTPIEGNPIAVRRNVAVAVRGSRAYFVGGVSKDRRGVERRNRDGAVLDLGTKRWRRLPDAPFRKTLPMGAIWAGRNLLVSGLACPGYVADEDGCDRGKRIVVARYSLDAKSWRAVPVPRSFVGRGASPIHPLVASSRHVVFARPGMTAVALDLRSGRWREVTPDLGWVNEPTCAVQRYAAFLGGAPPGAPNALHLVTPGAKRWDGPHAVDDSGQGVVQPGCTRDAVVATTFGSAPCPTACLHPDGTAFGRVQRYDLATGRWSDIPPPAFGTGLSYVPTGHGRFVDYLGPSSGPGTRLEVATGAWSPIAAGPNLQQSPVTIVWTRGLAVINGFRQLYVYRPV
jgi:hypothetical protein